MNLEMYSKNYTEIFDNRRKNRALGEVFVEDGIVLPEKWFAQQVRPLFLLKEAYGGTEDWSLLEHLVPEKQENQQSCGATWRKVTQWTYGILGTDVCNIPVFDEKQIPEMKYGNEMLKHIAIINVKKTAGEPNSDMKNINSVAKKDKYELQKQIALCNPTVIICGYTMDALNIIMESGQGARIKDDTNLNQNWYYKFELNGQEVIVLDYYHPSNQFPDLLNYYALMHIYQLALQDEQEAKVKIEIPIES